MSLDQTTIHERNQEQGLGSTKHPDGWGIAYPNEEGKFSIKKSTTSIFDDYTIDQLRTVETSYALLHVRRSSVGKVCLENNHPFRYTQKNGEEILFCHNGTITEEINFSPEFQPQGTTDSERFFCSILSQYQKVKNFPTAIEAAFASLSQAIDSNIILSTKSRTYVASRQHCRPKYLQMYIGRRNNLILVSSEKIEAMTDLTWEPLPPGEVFSIDHQTLQTDVIEL